MALLTPMTLAEAETLGRAHGLTVVGLQPLAAGSVNSNFRVETRERGPVFLRVYEEQDADGAQAELALVTALAGFGVRTPRPVRRRDGAWVSSHAHKPVGVYEWLPGEVLCQAQVTADHTFQVGSAIAQVHACSPRLSAIAEGRFGVGGIRARLERIAGDPRFAEDAARIGRRLDAAVSAARADLPSGLIHGDLYRDNALWLGGQLSALLDFESASRGAFVYDLMVCLHFWCFGAEFDLPLARALVAGYQSVRPLDASERAGFRAQGALGALRFASTRITDFAMRAAPGERPGRDYRRLLQRLDALDAGVLDELFR